MNTNLTLSQLLNLIGLVVVIGGGFYFTGQVTQTLEQLGNITKDHEDRIRTLEQR